MPGDGLRIGERPLMRRARQPCAGELAAQPRVGAAEAVGRGRRVARPNCQDTQASQPSSVTANAQPASRSSGERKPERSEQASCGGS